MHKYLCDTLMQHWIHWSLRDPLEEGLGMDGPKTVATALWTAFLPCLALVTRAAATSVATARATALAAALDQKKTRIIQTIPIITIVAMIAMRNKIPPTKKMHQQ